MSGLEVVGIVASVVSAFHGGAELVKMYRERRARRKQKRQQQAEESRDQMMQEMLHNSMEDGEMQISEQFLVHQRHLGRHRQLLLLGDDRARQELLMIAVSLQAEIIDGLGQAQQNLEVIVEMARLRSLHELAITRRHDALRSITELRQRIEVSSPLPRQSVDVALGLTRRSSNESLARSFVTAAANLAITDPSAQRLMPIRGPPRSQGAIPRDTGRRLLDLSSHQDLIPVIRREDIEVLTLSGEDAVVGASDSASANAPEAELDGMSYISIQASEHREQPLETAGPYFPPRHYSDTPQSSPGAARGSPYVRKISDSFPRATRMASAPIVSASPTVSEPDSATFMKIGEQRPYCPGAIAAQDDFELGISLHYLPTLPGSEKQYPCWKCNHCDFNASNDDDQLFDRIDFKHGVRFRFPYLARSHAAYKQPPDALKPRYMYGCLFCTAEGRKSTTHESSDALMSHIAARHRTNLTPAVRFKTKCTLGYVAGRDEDWDVNIPDVTGSSGGVAKWVLHAVTSL